MVLSAGSPLVVTTNNGTHLGFVGDGSSPAYMNVAGDIYLDGAIYGGGNVEVGGDVYARDLFIDQWYDNTVVNMNGVNVPLMTNAAHDTPRSANNAFTHTGGGIFRANSDFSCIADWQTLASTANTQITVQFLINSVVKKTFYNVYVPTVTNAMPLHCTYSLECKSGDFITILANGITGADAINTAGADGAGRAQTILCFTAVTV